MALLAAQLGRTLGLIPAKGHSRRIPGKNTRLLAGKPLLQYTIEAARGSGVLDTVMVSTEDSHIARMAADLGAEVPFLRDRRLAAGEVSVAEVAIDVLQRYGEQGVVFDALCILLPSSPLRSADDIIAAARVLAASPQADSVLSLTPFAYPPAWALRLDDQGRVKPAWPELLPLDRPQLPEYYYENGAVYWTRVPAFRRLKSQYGGVQLPYIMPLERGLDIDEPHQFALAEVLLNAMNSWGILQPSRTAATTAWGKPP